MAAEPRAGTSRRTKEQAAAAPNKCCRSECGCRPTPPSDDPPDEGEQPDARAEG
jgi:hypothetical protein